MELGIGSRVEHPNFGKGVVVEIGTEMNNIWFKNLNTVKGIGKSFELKIIHAKEIEADTSSVVSMADLEMVLHKVLDDRADIMDKVALGNKWTGGNMILKPLDDSMQGKEIPIETFFHKIVMVRDRIRVMEQQINAHKVLTDSEKVDLQQYITRIYGSLTTFNVLFRDVNDQFKGSGGDK
jgi:hypothetical protein